MKRKNPLFVVTNNGQDVEQSHGLFDALFKSKSLKSFVSFIMQLLEDLLSQVKTTAHLEIINAWLEKILDQAQKLAKIYFPHLYLFK